MKFTLLLHTSYVMQPSSEHVSDVLIVGSGAAGLSLALRLAQHCKVTVLSKGPLSEGATFYAQEGSPRCSMRRTALPHTLMTL